MKENEWIDENLRRVINTTGNVAYINRHGNSANYAGESDDVIITLEALELAKCDNFGGVLMGIGEIIRDKYNGSYLEYLEWLDREQTILQPSNPITINVNAEPIISPDVKNSSLVRLFLSSWFKGITIPVIVLIIEEITVGTIWKWICSLIN